MFCKYCGNQLPEAANFCPRCGKINGDGEYTGGFQTPNESEPVTFFTDATPDYEPAEAVNEAEEQERNAAGGGILTMAILSLAFAESFFLSWLGIIFAGIARKRVAAYLENYRETRGRATVGNILSKIGLGISIAMTAGFALWLFIMIMAIIWG